MKKTNKRSRSYSSMYSATDSLGKGGNAKVYKAVRKSDGKNFALKILSSPQPEKKQRFRDEIHVLKKLGTSIPGVLPIVDWSKKADWYVMPIAKPVQEYINEKSSNIEEIISGFVQLSETLEQLHSRGIVHRDIKPANVYYYNGRFSLGDFGLVDYPEKDTELTRTDKGLGAIFTIAPEMKRNPKNADGKKADVYSLAKTMWILLTGENRGFDGPYDFTDTSVGLRFRAKFEGEYLVELDELLTAACRNEPHRRPDIKEFKEKLQQWLLIKHDYEQAQENEWHFLNTYLFGSYAPSSSVWTDCNTISNVLNVLGALSAYNHMFFPQGGGLDFQSSKLAAENDCIYIYDDCGGCSLVKPKRLYFERFKTDYKWSYFLLELDVLNSITGTVDGFSEFLVEDYPGHYVSANAAQYGVYDYESGKKLPEGYRILHRYTGGKLLIVLKCSPYNSIERTYDGRHAMCTASDFKEYMCTLLEKYDFAKRIGLDPEQFINSSVYSANPFISCQSADNSFEEISPSPESFIEKNYTTWNFSSVLETSSSGSIVFYFSFLPSQNAHLDYLFSETLLVVGKDGCIHEYKQPINLDNIYYVSNREQAVRIHAKINEEIAKKCVVSGFHEPLSGNLHIELKALVAPTHLFSKQEIKEAMAQADDRTTNILVIDENGFVNIVQDAHLAFLYPVRNELWDAGNNYVGKYSSLSTLDDDYLGCLQKWLSFLKSGKRQYIDYVDKSNSNVEELIKEIRTIYSCLEK